jgi:hypothetical protein
MKSSRSTTFYCFSPPVMVATCVVEVSLLVYTLVRYKLSPVTRLVTAFLFFLAVFQLAEFNICGNFGPSALTWARIGFVAITMLPPLGIHLFQVISGYKNRWLTAAAYGSGLVWATVFGASGWAFSGPVCAGNYIIFDLASPIEHSYFVYYYFWLLATIGLCLWHANRAKPRPRAALLWLAAGYLVFVVPTALVNTAHPATTAGIPSIMCGFAVLFALILTFKILPKISKRTSR